MTKGIVQSDIELARKLIAAECSDSCIVASLCLRGLDPDCAAKLLGDLRQGVRAEVTPPPVAPLCDRERSRRVHSSGRPKLRASFFHSTTFRYAFRGYRRSGESPVKRIVRCTAAGVVCLGVFAGVVYVGGGRLSAPRNQAEASGMAFAGVGLLEHSPSPAVSTAFASDAAPVSMTAVPVSLHLPPQPGNVAVTQPSLTSGLIRANDAARLQHPGPAGRIEDLIAESKANPSDIGKRLLVATEYEHRKSPYSRDLDHALKEYQQVLECEVNNPDALFGLARVYYALGQLSKAEESIARAVQPATNRAPLLVMRAEILLGQKRYDEALQTVQQALALEPKSARAYYVLGSLYDSWKPNPDIAIEYYSKAIEIDPAISEAYFFRALQYDVKGLTVEAKTDLRTVERLDPESKWAGLSRPYLERMNQ